MRKYIALIIMIITGLGTQAQVVIEKSKIVKEINGQKYYIHTVEQGHTLYSICKTYDVSQYDINKANANFSQNISVGQEIKIPVLHAGQQNEPDFYWHKVAKGHTLYSLSKKYNVDVDDIIKHNPSAKFGLYPDQILKIPNVKKGNFDFQDTNYFYYTVEQGNTLFSISQQYGVDIDQIKLINPSVKQGLKVGMQLKLPKVNYTVGERLPIFHEYSPSTADIVFDPNYFEQDGYTPCNQYVEDKTKIFTVAVMLPLFLEENSSIEPVSKNGVSRLYKNSQIFFEMYEGMLLALERLKIEGISANILVFDTKNSTERVKTILKDPALKNADLIIGPVYSHNVGTVANFARQNKINMVSPLSQNTDVLKNNPFVFQVMPSREMRVKKTSDFLSKLYDTSIVFIHNGTLDEQNLINIYKQKMSNSFAFNKDLKYINIKNYDYKLNGEKNLEDIISVGRKNIIVLPTDDEVFVTKVVDRLYQISKKYDIELIGNPVWESFKSININYLRELSFNYVSPVYINYENWRVNSFIKNYRTAFKTEPSIYSYEGYDIMYYFVTALSKYGRHFQFCLSPYDQYPNKSGIVFEFDFVRTGTYNGFENNGTHILKYNNKFVLIKLKQ